MPETVARDWRKRLQLERERLGARRTQELMSQPQDFPFGASDVVTPEFGLESGAIEDPVYFDPRGAPNGKS